MEYPNRVKDTSTTEGTGNITCANSPPSTYKALGDKVAVGKSFPYGLFNRSANEWEIGTGTMLTATTFSRAPIDSSNDGALVNFSAGTKDVLCVLAGAELARLQRVTQTPFSAAIPLSTPGATYMATQTVSGPLTFTAMTGAVQGALAYLRLTADGTNTPNFSAFKEWGGSSGYDNRAGIVNQLQFFYDGADLFYSASQAVGVVPVAPAATGVTMTGPTGGVVSTASTNFTVGVTPVGGTISGTVVVTPSDGGNGGSFAPTTASLTSAQPTATFTYTPASTGAKTISVTNNGGLTNPANITYTVAAAATAPAQMAAPVATAGAGSVSLAFALPSNGGSAITSLTITPYIAGVAQTAINTTTLTSPYNVTGLTAGTAYTFKMRASNGVGPGPDSPESNSATPSAAATGPTTTAVTLANLANNLTLVSAGEYDGGNAGVDTSAGRGNAGALVLAGDGMITVDWDVVADPVAIGFDSVANPNSYQICDYFCWLYSDGQVYWASNSGTTTAIRASAAPGAAVRYGLSRTGDTVSIVESLDSGATWGTVFTFAAKSTATLYPVWFGKTVHRPRAAGLA